MSSCAICGWLRCVPTHSVAATSIAAAIATRGAGIHHAHQLCFTGAAATRARTRKSNAAEGSIIGNSSSKPLTARNSFTRRRHAAHTARCFSTSSRSLSRKRPSRYPRILFSIRLQLMTSPPLAPLLRLPVLRHEGGEFHSQRFIRPEEQRLQRALRALQNLRDLSVIQLLILVQQHGSALFLRKLFNRVTNHLLSCFLNEVLLDVRMLLGDVQSFFFAFFSIHGHRRIERNLHSLVPRVTYGVQRQIRRDPEKPSRELCARHIVFARPVHPQENFLRQIFRLLPVAHHPVQKID